MTLTFEQVERWLDDNPQLAEDYFVRKGTTRMVVLWNEAREECPDVFSPDASLIQNCDDRSAKNFRFNDTVHFIDSNEGRENISQVTLTEGRTRAQTSPITRRYSEPQRQPNPKRHVYVGCRKHGSSSFVDSLDLSTCDLRDEKSRRVRSPPTRQLRKTKSLPNCGQQHALGALIESKIRLPTSIGLNAASKLDLKNSNEKQFFFEIVRDIANDLDLTTLSYKILVNVGILTNADRCSLFLVEGPKGKQSLVSKVFDVQIGVPNSPAKEFIQQQKEITVPWGKGLVGYAAETGETVNIPDAYEVCNVLSINKSLGVLGVCKPRNRSLALLFGQRMSSCTIYRSVFRAFDSKNRSILVSKCARQICEALQRFKRADLAMPVLLAFCTLFRYHLV